MKSVAALVLCGCFATSLLAADDSLDDGKIIYGGEAAGYVLRLSDQRAIYFAGDTNVFSDMALIRELYAPQLAMLPIGGHYTMGPLEAAKAVHLLGVTHVVPMHYGMFAKDNVDVNRFIDHLLGHRPAQRFKVFQCGEMWALPVG